jgi:uncharacterized membrane protein
MSLRDTITPLNIVLVLLLAAATIAGFVLIPAGTILPVHWGIDGQPDNFMTRDFALMMLPGIVLLSLALVLFFASRPSERNRPEASRHALRVVLPGLLIVFGAIQTATVLIGTGQPVDMVRVVVFFLGILFIMLGNVMPKTQPNWVAGFRMPWLMTNPSAWQATHRVGGLLMMAGGFVLSLAALLTGDATVLLVVTFLGLFGSLLATFAYSLVVARR